MVTYTAKLYDILKGYGIDLSKAEIKIQEDSYFIGQQYSFAEPSGNVYGTIGFNRVDQRDEQPYRNICGLVRTALPATAEIIDKEQLDGVDRVIHVEKELLDEGYHITGDSEAKVGFTYVGCSRRKDNPIENIEGLRDQTGELLQIIRSNLKSGAI